MDFFEGQDIAREEVPSKIEERRAKARKYMQAYRSEGSDRDFASMPPPMDPERREACRYDLLLFMQTYYPDTFWRAWSDLHTRFVRSIMDVVYHGGQYVIAIPRGFGKTTIMVAAIEWALLYGHKSYALLISRSAEEAKRNLEKIETHLKENIFLCADFPEICLPVRAIGKQRQGANHITYKGSPVSMTWSGDMRKFADIPGTEGGGGIFACVGITGQIKGRNSPGKNGRETRPDMVLLDDPQKAEDAMSQTAIRKILRIISSDIMGLDTAGAPLSLFCSVTVAGPEDVGDTLCDRDKSPAWMSERIPAVIKWPTDAAQLLWQQYMRMAEEDLHVKSRPDLPTARAFYIAHREEMDEGAEVADPAFFDAPLQVSALQWCYEKLWRMGEFEFYCEYQQQPPQTALAEVKLTEDQIKARCRGELWSVPDWADFLIVGADLNPKTRGIVWSVWAWSRTLRGHLIDIGSFPEGGVIYTPGVTQMSYQDAIAQAIRLWCADMRTRIYTRQNGESMQISGMCIDASHEFVTVTETCKTLNTNLLPIRGRDNRHYRRPTVSDLRCMQGVTLDYDVARFDFKAISGSRIMQVNTDRVKLHLMQALQAPTASPSALTIAGDERSKTTRMIADELTSESLYRLVPDSERGDIYEYIKNPGKNNELLDCAVYSLAGALFAGAKYIQAPSMYLEDADVKIQPLPVYDTPILDVRPKGDSPVAKDAESFSIIIP